MDNTKEPHSAHTNDAGKDGPKTNSSFDRLRQQIMQPGGSVDDTKEPHSAHTNDAGKDGPKTNSSFDRLRQLIMQLRGSVDDTKEPHSARTSSVTKNGLIGKFSPDKQHGQITDEETSTNVSVELERSKNSSVLSQKIAEVKQKPIKSISTHMDVSDTNLDITEERQYTTPNEHTLQKLQPYLENVQGTIIATGSDQGLRLLAMCPQVSTLRVVEIDSNTTTVNYLYLESATRFDQLMQRKPTPQELIELYKNRELTLSLLALPPTEQYQHAFTAAELESITSLLRSAGQSQEFISYLNKQVAENEFFWMNKEHLPRILNIYEKEHIHIHHGNITQGEVMNSIAQSGENIGLIYLSNIVNHGYLVDQDINNLRNTMQNLNLSPNSLFINAIANVEVPTIAKPVSQLKADDWPYLLQDTSSFFKYANPNNPNIPRFSPLVIIRHLDANTIMQHSGDSVYVERAKTVSERP